MEVLSTDDRPTEEVLDGGHLAQLAAGEHMSVQYFEIEPGAVVEEHSHHHEQAGYLVEGRIRFVVDGEEYAVEPGDSYVIPGDAPHSAESIGDGPAVGVEIFSPPRPNPPWASD